MLTFFYNGSDLQMVSSIGDPTNPAQRALGFDEWNRNDFKQLCTAEQVAEDATELTGELYIATDAGRGCYPRYDVKRAPQIGDEVSYAFNGDYYPAGEITSISKTLKRVQTSTGDVFYRRKNSGSWIKDGTWSMVHGHHNDKNPHF